ncbi:Thioredoxin [Palleronia marisminoris]|uniref:Disulfide bond formation protein D n=1 Tax=Palleronia marisminoris TaxID=315423 RepID=A0A1Y5SM77_9RHOB|nr:DsbA family protein [Palleronia marisminoris]SFG83174.1 Thioredoxin [Palleronia marisminoris]SLN40883.1 Disulfide bond formation protein D precursor [Palleronia marisminoris]
MNKIASIAAATALVAGGAWYLQDSGSGTPAMTPFAPAQAQESSATEAEGEAVEVQEMTLGNPDAEIQVIEYASFTCPHCANFAETVYPELKENYIDTGKIEFVHREVYFDRYGLWAGMVARCDSDKYFGLSDLIYERQRDWAQGEPAEIAENLKRLGKTAGLSDEQLETCLADGAKAEALYATFQQNAEADDVTSTPTFIIDGEKYSNMGYDEFSSILDEKLGEEG